MAFDLTGAPNCGPFTLTTWNPDEFFDPDPPPLATFDAAVGITGYKIESFEDGALLPGLTISGDVYPRTSFIVDGSADHLRDDLPNSV